MIELELPYPPSVNHYYRHVGPRTLISREGRLYRERVAAELHVLGIEPAAGALVVTIELYPPDRRRRDADNTQKALLDALQHGGAYQDDSQIVKLTVEKYEPVAGGRVIVRIKQRKGYEVVKCKKCGKSFHIESALLSKISSGRRPNCPRCPQCELESKRRAAMGVRAYHLFLRQCAKTRRLDKILRFSRAWMS